MSEQGKKLARVLLHAFYAAEVVEMPSCAVSLDRERQCGVLTFYRPTGEAVFSATADVAGLLQLSEGLVEVVEMLQGRKP